MSKRNRHPPMLLPPPTRGDRRYPYLIGLKSGAVKIGITWNPRSRLVTHRKTIDIAWVHFFSPLSKNLALSVERLSMLYFASIGGRRVEKTEVFNGLDRRGAIAAVRTTIAVASEPDSFSTFGDAPRVARQSMAMTQETLAALVGSSKQCVSSWGAGRTEPSIGDLAKLCSALHVQVGKLIPTAKRQQAIA